MGDLASGRESCILSRRTFSGKSEAGSSQSRRSHFGLGERVWKPLSEEWMETARKGQQKDSVL